MRDGMLELWLRLLALHLPEPTNTGENEATLTIRDQWLLASRGYFSGHVPHDMATICAVPQCRALVRLAIESLLSALDDAEEPLNPGTLNLLGIEGKQFPSVERQRLKEIGWAFLDLLDGNISCDVSSTEVMPGSIPYKRID